MKTEHRVKVKIKLPRPHKNQELILQKAKRFNVVKCGRRFGKSSLIEELSKIILDGKRVGIWFPTYKDLEKIWVRLKKTFHAVITEKSEQLKQFKTITKGAVEFWSMEDPDSGRGEFYDRAIVDEGAKAKKLKQAWEQTIRPTLTDRKGDAWIFSTPKGKLNYFFELCVKARESVNWAFFHFTSYDNPFIDPAEIDEAKSQLDDLSFKQEYLAEDVDMNDKPYLYAFSEKFHVKHNLQINEALPIWMSFDFNVDPMTCIIGQRTGLKDLKIIKEVRIDNADIYEMCQMLKTMYQELIPFCFVTGDASGHNRSGSSKGKRSYWMIIRDELKLRNDQLKVRSRNLPFSDDRPLQNSVLQHGNIQVDASCKKLIVDLDLARVDEFGTLIKTSMEGRHFFDCYRYLVNANFPDWITNIKKYKQAA